MHDYLLSVILGIIEGLTEFLPVSSTAHLRIAQALLGRDLESPYWKMYTVVIQLGAVACVPIYFRKRIIDFLRTFPRGQNRDRNLFNHPLTLTLLAFAATAGPLLVLKKHVSENLENLLIIGLSLLIGGVVMWVIDVLFRKPATERMDQMNIPQAIWIGLLQILAAVFPGTSRSMATIAAGQTAGLSRAAALEFSFFLSIPTMFAACGKELLDVLRKKGDFSGTAIPMGTHQWVTLAIGFVVSFFVAWVVVAWFMAWVRKRGFVVFAVYRIILGVGVLIWALR